MDKNFFYSAGFPVPLYFEPTPWQNTLPSGDLNFQSDQSPDCFLTPQEPFSNFDSALSSMVSSPGASNSAISADGLAIQELIGKLRTIDNSSGEAVNMNAGSSVYSTPLNSPPELQLPVMNQLVNIRNGSHAMNPNLPALSAADPGFAERAAKFSCFGSRSFNGRSNQFGIELPYRSTPSLTRVLSSPSLKVAGSSVAANKNLTEMRSTDTKMEESSVSEQDLNSRKRKTPSLKGKPKESIPRLSANACKGAEQNGEANTKRSKSSENGGIKVENDCSGSDGGKDANQKAEAEAPKDYIHVRARRGQATDSHSLAERVRREKISERMKLLQDLVPGCNKVTGKAVMLDEIISYVQQLQQQVEFLSMKLASVNPTLEGLFTKDALSSSPHPAAYHHLDNSAGAAALFGQGNHYLLSNPQLVEEEEANNNNVDDQFGQGHLLPKLPSFSEDDLHSLVMMGFGQKTNNRTSTSDMKLELL